MDYSPDIQYAVKLTDGVPVWVKVKVVNGGTIYNINLFTIVRLFKMRI